MNVATMKQAIRFYYGTGSSFSKRLDTMSDSQVIAIYMRLKSKGVIR